MGSADWSVPGNSRRAAVKATGMDPAFKVIPRNSTCFLIWRVEVRYVTSFVRYHDDVDDVSSRDSSSSGQILSVCLSVWMLTRLEHIITATHRETYSLASTDLPMNPDRTPKTRSL